MSDVCGSACEWNEVERGTDTCSTTKWPGGGVPPATFSSDVKEPVDEVDALNSVSAGLKIIERENVLRVVVRQRL